MSDALIEVKDLKISFKSMMGEVDAVRGISFTIDKGMTLGLVGESGSGKSLTGLSMMGLVPKPNGFVKTGDVIFKGQSLYQSDQDNFQGIRGKQIAMIFQEPMTSLNPVFTIGDQIGESLNIHFGMTGEENHLEVVRLLKSVQIPSPEQIAKAYPHQLSGGMRQRVMIAMAMSAKPELFIADEPTTALDVTIQAQILRQMRELVNTNGVSLLFISHDLGVIEAMADYVAVMYCGRIVEYGAREQVLEQPLHPYTKRLIKARPENFDAENGYHTIPGIVPSLYELPEGCAFADRCLDCMTICLKQCPNEKEFKNGHKVSCWKYEGDQNV